jgi:Haem-NO-binding
VKGTIVKCLEELVKSKPGGPEAWKAILTKAGLPASSLFTSTGVVPDAEVLKLVGATAEVLKVSAQAAMDAFGDHWSTTYAPKIYGVYFEKAKNTRELLLSMDTVHTVMTKTAGATPPHFTYEDKGPKDLIMHYSSPRGLVALMPGLIAGVAKYYGEKVQVRTVGNALHIHFI